MSARTPEGKVKAMVKLLLKKFGAYYEMPVPGGYGKSGLDFNVCFNGFWLSIETKAPGKKATPRQIKTMHDISKAGGATLLIDGEESLAVLNDWLTMMTTRHPSQLFNIRPEELEDDIEDDIEEEIFVDERPEYPH